MRAQRKQLWAMMVAIAFAGGALAGSALAVTASTGASGGTATTGTTAPSSTAAGSGATTPTSTTGGGSSGVAADAPTSTLSPGQVQVANKISGPFVTMAGSQDNAVALATALRTGTTANLTFTSTSPTGETTQTAIELAIPTKPMGWGNVSHALALAQLSLRQAGIDNPTATDLQSALNGGTVTTADGKTVTLAGVLQQRAGGMGWGQIAKTYGTTMGAVNRGLKASTTTVTSSAPAPVGSTTTAKRTIATGATNGRGASGVKTTSGPSTNSGAHSTKGITTATGAVSINGASAHSAKGITTASGATADASSGVVSAAGHGRANAIGRGVVTAAGGGGSNSAAGARVGTSGVVTGSGASAMAVTTAQSGGGKGIGSGHGKGKGGS